MKIEEAIAKTKLGPQWSRIGIRHHHGVNVPLSALHTKDSCGIGEFYDLIPLIDWCKQVGMHVIQLLPLNDTGDDTSPFFATSSLALNPLFLSLHKLEGMEDAKLATLRHFNTFTRIPYYDVQSHKLLLLHDYFEENKERILTSQNFCNFVENNPWLEDYALFKILKDLMSKNHWLTWPPEMKTLAPKKKEQYLQNYKEQIQFHQFLQHTCFEQLTCVKRYANENGVYLKGDIPILISPDSVDVWKHTEEFDLEWLAGAPPDKFNAEGQAWGLPTFHWEVMKNSGYAWWRQRLSYATNFYDLYRIDHVLGFFRIWAIPKGAASKDGKFIPEDEADWLKHGETILSTITDFTSMLPIAEDLGVVPDSIRMSLSDMGVCGSKVIRWETHDDEGKNFIDPLHYNPISMTTVSTHDSETLAQWWQKDPDEAKPYAKYKGWDYGSTLSAAHRKEILWDSHHSSSFFHINLIGEYLALFPELVWDDPNDERINIPGTVSAHNWTYRLRPSMETLLAHEPLKEAIANLL